jgi:hypothetical protein
MNEAGENSHVKYKARQHERVKSRLSQGEKGLRELASTPSLKVPPPPADDDDTD